MPNRWTGKGNPYTRLEIIERLRATLKRGEPIIAAATGGRLSARALEKGGADLALVCHSPRLHAGNHGAVAGLMAYGDANALAAEIGEFDVLSVVEELPVVCGVYASDPRRRMWHWLLHIRDLGFSGVNNFPTHVIVDGQFRLALEESGLGVAKEFEMIGLARKLDLFSIAYVATTTEAAAMAQAGADAIVAHVGTTIGGPPGAPRAVCTLDEAARRTQAIIEAARAVRADILFLSHGGPIGSPEHAAYINKHSDCVGFVGAASLERLGVEPSLVEVTKRFKRIPAPAANIFLQPPKPTKAAKPDKPKKGK